MVTLEQMRASNARIPLCLPPGLVAVFVGGTSGIGESTMKQFAKHTVRPQIYYVGRCERAAKRIAEELHTLNPAGKYTFIKAELSLLANVDELCRDIKNRETSINLLFLTPGTMITGQDTSENLYYPTAVTYYARIRLIANLLPLLQRATSLRRVVSVLGGTKEGPLNPHDLPGRRLGANPNTGAPAASVSPHLLRSHAASLTTLALESLALEAPDVSFVHSFPGLVRGTNHGRDAAWASTRAGRVRKALSRVVEPMTTVSATEAGERQLFFATSARFPARGGVDVEDTAGVGPVIQYYSGEDGSGVGGVARGSDSRAGSGVYSVGYDGEPAGQKVEELVQRLRDEDLVRTVWLHTVGEFVRVTGSEFLCT